MKQFGPGLLVAAAFIGPGTVTTASMAGANYGYALVWALLFSVVATFVLQEMASRLGIITGSGLAEALRKSFDRPAIKLLVITLVVGAIGIGNAAYQAGNLAGAALGISSAVGGSIHMWSVVLGLFAAVLLASGQYKILERTLISLVAAMSIVFIITMFMASPDWGAIASDLLAPSIPPGSILTVIALIGTTVVPYNLFLHASIVAQKKQTDAAQEAKLSANRMDTSLSIGLGGLVTLAVMSCAASAFFATGTSVSSGNIATQLEPLLGDFAKYFFALGLFAAGLSSAITAPLAAAYAVCGAMGWPTDLKHNRFKIIWLLVLLFGVAFASFGIKPLVAILFAQATNGLLLPIIAIFLICVMNQSSLLGQHRNGLTANIIGGAIVLVVSCLGLYKLASLFF